MATAIQFSRQKFMQQSSNPKDQLALGIEKNRQPKSSTLATPRSATANALVFVGKIAEKKRVV